MPRHALVLAAAMLLPWSSAARGQTPAQLLDVNATIIDPSSSPEQITRLGGLLLLRAATPASGIELFTSFGQPRTTSLLRDLRPGPESSSPDALTVVGSIAFFTADDGALGRELWKTDGTSAGTRLVRDISPGAGSANPTELTALGGLLFFAADDGQAGEELWRSDGTTAGTVRVADIVPGAGSSTPRELTAGGGELRFRARQTNELCVPSVSVHDHGCGAAYGRGHGTTNI